MPLGTVIGCRLGPTCTSAAVAEMGEWRLDAISANVAEMAAWGTMRWGYLVWEPKNSGPANIADRDGAQLVLAGITTRYLTLRHL